MERGRKAVDRAGRKNTITPERLWKVLKQAVAGWWNDNVPRMGAALAYYTLFALAPILFVAIAVAGLAFGAEAVRGEIVGQIEGLVGRDGALAVQAMLEGAAKPSSSIPATIIGIITPGMGWFMYLFLIPFWAMFPIAIFGSGITLYILIAYLVGFPIAKLLVSRSDTYRTAARDISR